MPLEGSDFFIFSVSDQTLPLVISLEKFKPELTSSCLKTWFGSVEIYKQKVEYSSISDLCRTEIGHKTKKQEFQTHSLKNHKILSYFPSSIYQVRWAKCTRFFSHEGRWDEKRHHHLQIKQRRECIPFFWTGVEEKAEYAEMPKALSAKNPSSIFVPVTSWE